MFKGHNKAFGGLVGKINGRAAGGMANFEKQITKGGSVEQTCQGARTVELSEKFTSTRSKVRKSM